METEMKIRTALVLALVALTPTVAMASPSCTTEPKDKWMSEEAMKAKVAELGYTIKTFQITGDCYEIYGSTKDNKRAEVYFNPVTGDVVEAEIDG
jgi:hypothetical protein